MEFTHFKINQYVRERIKKGRVNWISTRQIILWDRNRIMAVATTQTFFALDCRADRSNLSFQFFYSPKFRLVISRRVFILIFIHLFCKIQPFSCRLCWRLPWLGFERIAFGICAAYLLSTTVGEAGEEFNLIFQKELIMTAHPHIVLD